jgi:hypothetical protein
VLQDILDAIKPREERVTLGGHVLVVREIAIAADVAFMQDNADLTYKLVVRCVFDEAGEPAFDESDIPGLKKAGKTKLLPLIEAVNRVNGFDIEHEAKNSSAAPADGSSTS